MAIQYDTAEFRVDGPDVWEKTPVTKEVTHDGFGDRELSFNNEAMRMAIETGKTVRWNYKGCVQGHYVAPSHKEG